MKYNTTELQPKRYFKPNLLYSSMLVLNRVFYAPLNPCSPVLTFDLIYFTVSGSPSISLDRSPSPRRDAVGSSTHHHVPQQLDSMSVREESSPTWRQRHQKRISRDSGQQQQQQQQQQQPAVSTRSDLSAPLQQQQQQQRPASDTEDSVAERFFAVASASADAARRSLTPGPGPHSSQPASARHSGYRPPSIAVQELDDSPRSQRHSLLIPQQPSTVHS